jgi:hypothetical protein
MDECNPYYEDAAWAFYRFVPSVPANVLFIVLFAISAVLHTAQLLRTKTWYLIALVVGALCNVLPWSKTYSCHPSNQAANPYCALGEIIGYLGRILNALEEPGCWTLGPYIMQNVLILIGPAFMAASIYMILGRIILLTDGEKYALIKRRWLTKLFVAGDVVSLLMQSSGATPCRRYIACPSK